MTGMGVSLMPRLLLIEMEAAPNEAETKEMCEVKFHVRVHLPPLQALV